uniref:Si:dkey-32m20.1 n=1 Tax=Echeneis naucrates TaxID=173247 RepID=A0A665X3Y8_ECHNA
MPSGKMVKFILYEVLQFAALIVPIFVIMERFALLIHRLKKLDLTVYWLVVAVSIAYVTSVTLLVWAPLKYVILKRPTALAYLILSTLPCFAVLIASSKVQVDMGCKLDHFVELPVSLVLFSLICVDIIERIRPCNLTGKSDSLNPDFDMPGPVLTHLEQVTTVSAQLHPNESQNSLTQGRPETRNGRTSRRWEDFAGSPSSRAYLYSSSSRSWSYSGPFSFLWWKDERSEVVLDSFLFWLDTAEMLRITGETSIFYSGWVFPVYILCFLSTLRIIITPQNPLLSFAGFFLQDLPFFIIRVALIAVFGNVTPVFYPLKNVLVSLTFIYFTFLTKLRIFNRRRMF